MSEKRHILDDYDYDYDCLQLKKSRGIDFFKMYRIGVYAVSTLTIRITFRIPVFILRGLIASLWRLISAQLTSKRSLLSY
jgi:hypothetical protein